VGEDSCRVVGQIMAEHDGEDAAAFDEEYAPHPSEAALAHQSQGGDQRVPPRCDPEGPKEIRRHMDQAIEQTPQNPGPVLAQGPLKLLLDGGPVDPLLAKGGRQQTQQQVVRW